MGNNDKRTDSFEWNKQCYCHCCGLCWCDLPLCTFLTHVCAISQYLQYIWRLKFIEITMGKGKVLTEVEKAKISTLKDYLKLLNRQVAKEIDHREYIVRKFLQNPEKYGENKSIGRPSSISNTRKRQLLHFLANNSKSETQVKTKHNITVGIRLVWQILKASKHFFHTKMKRKPMLPPTNIKGRLEFPGKHIHCTNQCWKIIYSY